MKFLDSIALLAFLDKKLATKKSINPIKLNYNWKELEPKKHVRCVVNFDIEKHEY